MQSQLAIVLQLKIEMSMRILGFEKSGTILTSESEWSNLKLVNHRREEVKSTCYSKKLKYTYQPNNHMYLFHDGFRSLTLKDLQ